MQLNLSPKATYLDRQYFYGQMVWSFITGSTVLRAYNYTLLGLNMPELANFEDHFY